MSEVLWESFDRSARLTLVSSSSRALISQRDPSGQVNVVNLSPVDGFLLGVVLRRVYGRDEPANAPPQEEQAKP